MTFLRKTLVSSLIFYGVSSPAIAEDLYEVLSHTLLTHPEIRVANEQLKSAKEDLTQAQGNMLPSVSANGSIQSQKLSYDSGTPTTSSRPKFVQLTATQTLFSGGSLISTNRSVRNLLRAEEATKDVVVQNILLNTAETYLSVLESKDILKLHKHQLENLAEQLKATEIRFRAGELTKTDVQQAKARYAAAKASLLNAEGELVSAQESLKENLGYLPEDIIWPRAPRVIPSFTEELKESVLENHPQVVSALYALAAAKYGVKSAKGKHYPQVEAQASVGKYYENRFGGDYEDRTISLNVSIPLFQGGKTLSSVRQSQTLRNQAEATYESVRRSTGKSVEEAYNYLETTEASMQAYKEAESAATLALEGVEKESVFGTRSVLDVLDAKQELLDARTNFTSAKKDWLLAQFRVLSAIGRLTSLQNIMPIEGSTLAHQQN